MKEDEAFSIWAEKKKSHSRAIDNKATTARNESHLWVQVSRMAQTGNSDCIARSGAPFFPVRWKLKKLYHYFTLKKKNKATEHVLKKKKK